MKNTFKFDGINITVDGNPVEIKPIEFTNEISTQELATNGGLIMSLIKEIKPYIDMAIQASNKPATTTTPINKNKNNNNKKINNYKSDNNYNKNNYKNDNKKYTTPELPKHFSITKEWRKITIPESLKSDGVDKYRWTGKEYPIGDSVSVDGSTYGVIYIHIHAMKKKAFVVVRNNNVRFEDDIKPEEFNEFLDVIDIPKDIKNYIEKVIAI